MWSVCSVSLGRPLHKYWRFYQKNIIAWNVSIQCPKWLIERNCLLSNQLPVKIDKWNDCICKIAIHCMATSLSTEVQFFNFKQYLLQPLTLGKKSQGYIIQQRMPKKIRWYNSFNKHSWLAKSLNKLQNLYLHWFQN